MENSFHLLTGMGSFHAIEEAEKKKRLHPTPTESEIQPPRQPSLLALTPF
jgi:hypothetical protein